MSAATTKQTTVAQQLIDRARQTPEAIAFHTESAAGQWTPVTWREFAARVETLRFGLCAAGLRSGDRFALIAPVSLEWELLHHAALGIGAVVVGLDAHDLPERIASMAAQAKVAAIATTDVQALSCMDAQRMAACHFVLDMKGGPAPLPDGTRLLSWSDLGNLSKCAAAVENTSPPPPAPSDMATIIFTSGTTGGPKGIGYTHAQLCLAIEAICEAFDFVSYDGRLLCWLPLSNLFQRMVNLAGVRKGVGTYLLSDPRRVMEVVGTVSPDIFVSVPRFYEKLYEGIQQNIAAQPPFKRKLARWAWDVGRRVTRSRLEGRPITAGLTVAHSVAERLVLARIRQVMGTRLRCMVSGSAPIPKHLLEEFHALGWPVLEAYGLSENVLPMAMNRIDAYRLGTVGQPVPGNEIKIDSGGAVLVRGPGVFSGYLDSDAADAARFDEAGFYQTGDLGEFDTAGYLRLTGRSSELIKTSTGRRVAPTGVEAQLRGIPGIDQAVLIGNGRKCLVALCTLTPGQSHPREQLEQAIRTRLERVNEHEKPLGIALLDKPLSIDRGELTPNLKMRRTAIEQSRAEAIEALYRLVQRTSSGKTVFLPEQPNKLPSMTRR